MADVERRREHALPPRWLGPQTVIHADIVANHGTDVAGIARRFVLAVVAYQQNTAFVVMAIVVLDQGVSAVKPEAYKLEPGSPCIGAGKVVKGNGGRDFFGNPVPANAPPTMGAFQTGPQR